MRTMQEDNTVMKIYSTRSIRHTNWEMQMHDLTNIYIAVAGLARYEILTKHDITNIYTTVFG